MAKKQEQQPEIVKTVKTTAEQYIQVAENLKILTEEDYTEATNILLRAKEAAKLAEEEKNKVLKPLKAALKAEQDRWKPLESLFTKINELVRPKMLGFVNEKERKARAEQEALAKKIEAGMIKKAETIERHVERIKDIVPDRTIHTGSGSSSIRKIKTMNIVNESQIPDEFWVIDMVKLREAVLKKDIAVPGTTVTYENSLAIF